MKEKKNLIEKNLLEIKEDIKKYSPYPEKVKLVAVTKYFGPEGIEVLLEAGHKIVGENKGQVIRDKVKYFNEKNINDIEWHFIGNLQKNKVKYIYEYITLIHSVNKLSLAEEINKKASEAGRIIDILLEINIAGEESKEGYDLGDLTKEIPQYLKLTNIRVVGLMTMAPNVDDEKIVRGVFSKLREIKDELNIKHFNNSLTELSMGMSGDYKYALLEGATIIRVGSKIFS